MNSSASAQRNYKAQHTAVKDPAILSFQRSNSMISTPQSQTSMASHPQAAYPEHRALKGRGLMTRGKSSSHPVAPVTHHVASVTSPAQAMVPPVYVDIPVPVAMRNNSSSSSSNNNARSSMHRERGVIEKMLHSYGFIQCSDRECRLFFHYSELTPDDTYSFAVGDPVEFHQGMDRRTNKPVAVGIVRLPSLELNCEVISEKPVIGKVLAVAKSPSIINLQDGEMVETREDLGRVMYEQSGETFFLTYTVNDIEHDNPLSLSDDIVVGDQVEFYISTDERNGNLRARRIRRIAGSAISDEINPAQVYTGVVCSLKDNYGFIERADVVKELFFHFSELQNNMEELQMGDDVSFNIQTRNGKEVGVNIHLLPPGTVIFEDIAPEKKRGKIQKLLKPVARTPVDPLSGRIVYETLKGPIEIPYGERDQVSEFTMQLGDIVEFYIATDRRDKLRRATNISLVDVTFTISGEKREQGFIAALKEGFGFIRCVDREGRMFFNFGEVLTQSRPPKVQDEVEFTVSPDPSNVSRLLATRVRYLPRGSINEEECVSAIRYTGVVAKPALLNTQQQSNTGSPNKLSAALSLATDPDPGIILYDIDGTKQTIPYNIHSLISGQTEPKQSDQVEFCVSESLRNNTKTAVMVRVIVPATLEPAISASNHSKASLKCVGGFSNGTSGSISSSASNSSTFNVGGNNSSIYANTGGSVFSTFTSAGTSNSSTSASASNSGTSANVGGSNSSSSVVMRSSHKDKDGIRAKRMSSGASIGSLSHSSGSASHSGDAPPKSSRHSVSGTPRSRKSNGHSRQETENEIGGSVFSPSDTSVGVSQSVSSSTQSSAVTGNESSLSVDSDVNGGTTVKELGFMATLKDGFGFIEMADRDKEVFFHYSNYDGDAAELDVGDEVEFTFAEKTGRISAARVKRRTKGTIIPEEILPGIYEGEIVRGLRITNPDQAQYCGLIQLCDTLSGSAPLRTSPENNGSAGRIGDGGASKIGDGVAGKTGEFGETQRLYTYGVMSLVDRRDLPQKGDQVRFQLSVMRASSSSSGDADGGAGQGGVAEVGYRATRVLPVRKLVHAKVDSIKGQSGTLSYETDDGKRLTFSLADCSNTLDGSELCVGDDVEFVPVRRPHGGKMIACCVRKIGDRPRPERLSRLKSVAGNDEGPRIVAIRQPRGPDGSKGFKPDAVIKSSSQRVISSSSSPQLSSTLMELQQQQPAGGSGSANML